jgi:hypothetical protein
MLLAIALLFPAETSAMYNYQAVWEYPGNLERQGNLLANSREWRVSAHYGSN